MKKIAEGGMGEIFLAEDTSLQRQVALKSLPSHLTADKSAIDRFRREAQAAAALKHPNIVTVYEFFKHRDKFFIAMEYIDGVSLRQLIEQRQVSVRKAILIVIQVCRALREAHRLGIIHRDIKPENIMVGPDGWVKILDFGLARLAEFSRITRYGARVGTTPYISPEQIRGEKSHPASDIFSLGVVLYELLTRRHPFEGKSEEEILMAILKTKPPRLSRHQPRAWAGLEKIIETALRKEPEKRFASAEDMMTALKKEKRHYNRRIRQHKSKELASSSLSVKIRDVNTKRLKLRWIRLTTAVLVVKSRLFGSRRAKLSSAVMLTVILLCGVCLSLLGSRLQYNSMREYATKPIESLLREKQTYKLQKNIDQLTQRNLVKSGRDVDFSALSHCFLFIVDSVEVADVYVVKNNLFYSLSGGSSHATLPNKFAGKSKIWVQDISFDN